MPPSPEPRNQSEPPLWMEEYWERRVETATGHLIERQARWVRWGPPAAEGPGAREVVAAAAPLIRALVVSVVAPALGRLAVRALAPRLLRALPPAASTRRLGQRGARRPRATILGPERRVLGGTPAPSPPALPPGGE
ncbi:MAG TPA: hypothetical protein VKZ60_15125 [Chloroflexota bacterium]|nr:hypothetical protein [Chloroflexota bacterium]